MTNLYKVLGVPDFAGTEEIKTAYRKLSKKFHPDVNDGDKFFEERFKEIQNAYEILTDTNKRNIHDEALRRQGSGSAGYGHTAYREEPVKEEPAPKPASGGKRQKNFSYGNFWAISLLIFITVTTILVVRTQGDGGDNENIEEPADAADIPSYNEPPPQTAEPAETLSTPLPDADPLSKSYFTLGSTQDEVLQIQGTPGSVYKGLNEEVWKYEYSSVTFKDGKVDQYSNTSDNLRVTMPVSDRPADPVHFFTIGSSKDEVLQIQGTPGSIYKGLGEEVWKYGYSSVTFKDGKVQQYSNTSDNLKVRL